MSGRRRSLMFGIYPGSALGGEYDGPPDCPDRINRALDLLQGDAGRPFLVRAYDTYVDGGAEPRTAPIQAPARYEQYLDRGRRLDLVVQFHSQSGDVDGYCDFVRGLIRRHGPSLATVQICEEPNITGDDHLDGAYPRVREALIAGVHAAREVVVGEGLRDLRIGCNSAPLIGPAATFFSELTALGGSRFIAELDYVGLDFFPDVFRPIASDRLAATAAALLTAHRNHVLAPAGLGGIPLVITEHGWPTGPDRSMDRQAEVVRTVLDVIACNAEALGITGYIHHSLRDWRSAGQELLCQFGLMTDDYTPKPAFHVYRELIAAGIA